MAAPPYLNLGSAGIKTGTMAHLVLIQGFGENKEMSETIIVDFPGRDRIEAQKTGSSWSIRVIGCADLQTRMQEYFATEIDLSHWSLPEGESHVDLLIRELILKAQAKWNFPYRHEELCHCRSVPAEVVDQAVLAGAHTCAQVSRRTSASTACATCRPEVQKIINYRLGR